MILPDLPIEEANDWLTAAQRVGLHTVFVVAPATNDARLTRICSAAGGMLYAPAVPGITGSTCPLDPALPAFVHRLRTATDLPIGVGIGISTPAQAQAASRIADVTIVGSALIRAIDAAQGTCQQEGAAVDFARLLTAATAPPGHTTSGCMTPALIDHRAPQLFLAGAPRSLNRTDGLSGLRADLTLCRTGLRPARRPERVV
ncbi:tryptophan synthase subunit alpha [Streptomyces sp. NPDC058740]|uniref:tryptophan synthase subunit alpha n=1 Tax=Streptomyces sp. NPDC058740 TaxID=3346619 RepID=UPI003686CB13